MLKGKNILLGITGSISAYKSAILTRLLIKAGANVKIIMTESATDFISPLTLSTLSKHPVYTKYFEKDTGQWNNHVELGMWADVFIIAPASANTLGKFANGISDNLLSATYLSAKCQVYIAPAMDLDMWKHGSTQQNIKRLKSFGNKILQPNTGELASGLHGEGRLAEPEEIIHYLENSLSGHLPLTGKNVLITAGPTYEAIDPVRYIGNHSSGKMGYALAESFAEKGAEVFLVSGPTNLSIDHKMIEKIDVVSAAEMFDTCNALFEKCDIGVFSAAVADYTPTVISSQKLKKQGDLLGLELKKTTDILEVLGKRKTKKQMLIGFALETENELVHAQEKLKKKNLDFIVLNSLNDKGAGFKTDTNKITILDKYNNVLGFELKTKKEVADDIVQKIISLLS